MRTRQSGFSMIEVLVTIAILMLGLLGLAGLQTQISVAEFEAYQRSQALVIVQDMADRMSVNKMLIKATPNLYVIDDVGAAGADQDCTGLTGAALDLCQFNNILIGAAEKADSGAGPNVGTMLGARGCITSPAANLYVITVAWQGMVPTAVPEEACGLGAYGDDRLRRTVSLIVRRATL